MSEKQKKKDEKIHFSLPLPAFISLSQSQLRKWFGLVLPNLIRNDKVQVWLM